MFDKLSLAIRDVIIYVIPGLISTFCLVYVLNSFHFFGEFNIFSKIKESTNFGIFVLLFSFLVGFLSSQFQIIVFWAIFSHGRITLLKDIEIDTNIKSKIALGFAKLAQIEGSVDESALFGHENCFSICQNYVNLRTDADTKASIDRESYMASFAISSFFPIALATIVVALKLIPAIGTFGVSFSAIIFITFLLILIKKIAFNFRKGWSKIIYYQFLLLYFNKDLGNKSKPDQVV
jgi:hypothetical protein